MASSSKKTPQPPTPALPGTLAQRVQYWREAMDWSQRKLAEKAAVSESFIQDLESGLETFLAPAVRQKLARALRIKPILFQEVEKRPDTGASTISRELVLDLFENIQANPTRKYFCPQCGATLEIRTFERRDMHNVAILAIKVNCSKCLFRMEND